MRCCFALGLGLGLGRTAAAAAVVLLLLSHQELSAVDLRWRAGGFMVIHLFTPKKKKKI
jgi:hypothetical protein